MSEKSILVWAFEHPYLYTLIQLKLPVIIAFTVIAIKLITNFPGRKK